MDRRRFLINALTLSGGVAATSVVTRLLAEDSSPLMSGPAITELKSEAFTVEQRKLVSVIAETILPRTDTPGAIDAGVPAFLENMVAEWLTDDERAVFFQGLDQLEILSQATHKTSFVDLTQGEREDLLEQLESDASDSDWYAFGNVVRDFVPQAPFICQIKELTIFGFFSSEAGAKDVLRHNPMPGRFDGELALGTDESSWSTIRLM
ncbi:gluconate 2-dehydrogenase subunit 3 family protein [Parendozoicomonas haliclonae]|uniref:Gluconate 2-dehydrogenase subunit 3 n=1 Tax=Parendozoicomonas haliclonae TaxID=1960125 RepID=A0A1X7AGJ6_9GAMM|nr:gluconate 2-dehydrogenase subunit 3 family protein [Parendozoicomonas haliclonae]SMA38998.1 hypothetical protein EHSB41UT_00957 [Parendozoicomonas haliclonae]